MTKSELETVVKWLEQKHYEQLKYIGNPPSECEDVKRELWMRELIAIAKTEIQQLVYTGGAKPLTRITTYCERCDCVRTPSEQVERFDRT
jgi:hypothetical protein